MKRLTRLAVGAGAALGLSAWVAPVAAGAEGLPQGPPFRRRRRSRRLRPDRQHRRQPDRRLRPGRRRHPDPGQHLRHRRTGWRAQRLGSRPPRLSGLAGLRPDARPALRGECRQQHGFGLLGPGRRPDLAPGGGLGRRRSRSASPCTAIWCPCSTPRTVGSCQVTGSTSVSLHRSAGDRIAPLGSPSPRTPPSSPTRRDKLPSRPTAPSSS